MITENEYDDSDECLVDIFLNDTFVCIRQIFEQTSAALCPQ